GQPGYRLLRKLSSKDHIAQLFFGTQALVIGRTEHLPQQREAGAVAVTVVQPLYVEHQGLVLMVAVEVQLVACYRWLQHRRQRQLRTGGRVMAADSIGKGLGLGGAEAAVYIHLQAQAGTEALGKVQYIGAGYVSQFLQQLLLAERRVVQPLPQFRQRAFEGFIFQLVFQRTLQRSAVAVEVIIAQLAVLHLLQQPLQQYRQFVLVTGEGNFQPSAAGTELIAEAGQMRRIAEGVQIFIDAAGKQLCQHPVAGAVLYAGLLQLDQHARFRQSKFLLRVMPQTQTCVVAQQRWFVLRFTLIQAEIGRNKRVGLWQEQR